MFSVQSNLTFNDDLKKKQKNGKDLILNVYSMYNFKLIKVIFYNVIIVCFINQLVLDCLVSNLRQSFCRQTDKFSTRCLFSSKE